MPEINIPFPGFRKVTHTEFYAKIGPLDVNVSAEKHYCAWKLKNGSTVGYSTPGYLCQDNNGKYTKNKSYFLKESQNA